VSTAGPDQVDIPITARRRTEFIRGTSCTVEVCVHLPVHQQMHGLEPLQRQRRFLKKALGLTEAPACPDGIGGLSQELFRSESFDRFSPTHTLMLCASFIGPEPLVPADGFKKRRVDSVLLGRMPIRPMSIGEHCHMHVRQPPYCHITGWSTSPKSWARFTSRASDTSGSTPSVETNSPATQHSTKRNAETTFW